MALANGRMPADRLREVEPGMFLEASTATAYLKAKAASGGILKIASPAGAYRSYAVQVDMKANPGKYGLDPASSITLAAPGSSTHGWGTRVDIAVGAGRTWAIVRLPDYGFKREFGSADPGHFQYLTPSFAGTGSTPIQGDNMAGIIRDPSTGALTTIDGPVYQHHTSMASYQADVLTYGPYKQAASQAEYKLAVANSQVKLAYLTAAQTGTPGSAVDVDAIAAKVNANIDDHCARLSAEIATVNANIDDQPTTFTGTLS